MSSYFKPGVGERDTVTIGSFFKFLINFFVGHSRYSRDCFLTFRRLQYRCMKEALQLAIDEHAQLADGSEVWTQLILPEWEDVILSETEEHETIHAVVGEKVHSGSVEKVSTVPGPGYLGFTQMSFLTAEAAIAPDALQMRGTGHDRALVAHMGANAGAAAAVARSIVGHSTDEIKSVGFELKKKKVLSGHEARSAMARVYEGQEMEVFRLTPDGQQHSFIQKVDEHVVFAIEALPLAA